MSNKLFKVLSLLLVAVMVFQMLPVNVIVMAADSANAVGSVSATQNATLHTGYQRLKTAEVFEEDITKRGEYYKEFVLNNGLRMATLYPYAVHYEKDGQWEEIDNTLIAVGDHYTNTAGEWSVSFPKSMNTGKAVSIRKDGYTLQFYMTGELRSNGNRMERASLENDSGEVLSVQGIQTATAQVEKVDRSEFEAEQEYPEMFSEKTQSHLQYANVYSGQISLIRLLLRRGKPGLSLLMSRQQTLLLHTLPLAVIMQFRQHLKCWKKVMTGHVWR